MQYSSAYQGMGGTGGTNGNGPMEQYSQHPHTTSTYARVPPLSSDSHSHASSSYVAVGGAAPSPSHRGYGASGPNPFFEGQLGGGVAGVGVPSSTGGPFGNLTARASGGGGTPEELVASAQQSVHAVANEVMRLERNVGIATIDDVEKTELRLEQARSMLREAMDSAALGALFRQKASHQMQEAQSLSEALVRLRRNITLVAQRGVERQALLGDRGSKAGAGNAVAAAKSSLSDTAHLKNERESLIHSATKLRSLVSESNAILGALKGQGDTMQGTHNRLAVDFLEAIGIGNHTLLQIARTTKLDALVVYIGIGLTMLLMLYILFK